MKLLPELHVFDSFKKLAVEVLGSISFLSFQAALYLNKQIAMF
ncbi:hypothetical protein [Pseudomonas triticicola]